MPVSLKPVELLKTAKNVMILKYVCQFTDFYMDLLTFILFALQDDMDLKALGFDIAEGVNDPYLPGDCGIFVTRVDKGSIADGRLR